MPISESSECVANEKVYAELIEELRGFRELLVGHGLIVNDGRQKITNTNRSTESKDRVNIFEVHKSKDNQSRYNHSNVTQYKRKTPKDSATNRSEATIQATDNPFTINPFSGTQYKDNQSIIKRFKDNQANVNQYKHNQYRVSQPENHQPRKNHNNDNSSKVSVSADRRCKSNLSQDSHYKDSAHKDNRTSANRAKDNHMNIKPANGNGCSDDQSRGKSHTGNIPIPTTVTANVVNDAIKQEIIKKENYANNHFQNKNSGLSFLLYVICNSCGSGNIAYEATCQACESKYQIHWDTRDFSQDSEKAQTFGNKDTVPTHLCQKLDEKNEKIKIGENGVPNLAHGLKKSKASTKRPSSDRTTNHRRFRYSLTRTLVNSERRQRAGLNKSFPSVDIDKETEAYNCSHHQMLRKGNLKRGRSPSKEAQNDLRKGQIFRQIDNVSDESHKIKTMVNGVCKNLRECKMVKHVAVNPICQNDTLPRDTGIPKRIRADEVRMQLPSFKTNSISQSTEKCEQSYACPSFSGRSDMAESVNLNGSWSENNKRHVVTESPTTETNVYGPIQKKNRSRLRGHEITGKEKFKRRHSKNLHHHRKFEEWWRSAGRFQHRDAMKSGSERSRNHKRPVLKSRRLTQETYPKHDSKRSMTVQLDTQARPGVGVEKKTVFCTPRREPIFKRFRDDTKNLRRSKPTTAHNIKDVDQRLKRKKPDIRDSDSPDNSRRRDKTGSIRHELRSDYGRGRKSGKLSLSSKDNEHPRLKELLTEESVVRKPINFTKNIGGSFYRYISCFDLSSMDLSDVSVQYTLREKYLQSLTTFDKMTGFDGTSMNSNLCRVDNVQRPNKMVPNKGDISDEIEKNRKQILDSRASRSQEFCSKSEIYLDKRKILQTIEDICDISLPLSPLSDVHNYDRCEEVDTVDTSKNDIRPIEIVRDHLFEEQINNDVRAGEQTQNYRMDDCTKKPPIECNYKDLLNEFEHILISGDFNKDILCSPGKRFKHDLGETCGLNDDCPFPTKETKIKSGDDIYANANNCNNEKNESGSEDTVEATSAMIESFVEESEEFEIMDFTYEYDMLHSPIVLKASDRVYNVKNIDVENKDESAGPSTSNSIDLNTDISTVLSEVRKSDDILVAAMESAGLTESNVKNFMDENFDLGSIIFFDEQAINSLSDSESQDADNFLLQILGNCSSQEDAASSSLNSENTGALLNEDSVVSTKRDSSFDSHVDNLYPQTQAYDDSLLLERPPMNQTETDRSCWTSETFVQSESVERQSLTSYCLEDGDFIAPPQGFYKQESHYSELWDRNVSPTTHNQCYIDPLYHQQDVNEEMSGQEFGRNTNDALPVDNSSITTDASCETNPINIEHVNLSRSKIRRGNDHVSVNNIESKKASNDISFVSKMNEIKLKNRSKRQTQAKLVVARELEFINGSDTSRAATNKLRRSKRSVQTKEISQGKNWGKTKPSGTITNCTDKSVGTNRQPESTPDVMSEDTFRRPKSMLRRCLRSKTVRNLNSSSIYGMLVTSKSSKENSNNNSDSIDSSSCDLTSDQSESSSSEPLVTDNQKQQLALKLKQRCRELDQQYRKRYQSPLGSTFKSSLSLNSDRQSDPQTSKGAVTRNIEKHGVVNTKSTSVLEKSESELSADDKTKRSLINFVTRIRGGYGDQFPVASKISKAKRHELCNRYLQHHNLSTIDVSFIEKFNRLRSLDLNCSNDDLDGKSTDTCSSRLEHHPRKDAIDKTKMVNDGGMARPRQVGVDQSRKPSTSPVSFDSEESLYDLYVNTKARKGEHSNCESVGILTKTNVGIPAVQPSTSATVARLNVQPVSPRSILIGKIERFESDFQTPFSSAYVDASSPREDACDCSPSSPTKTSRSKKHTKKPKKSEHKKKLLSILKKFESLTLSSEGHNPISVSGEAITHQKNKESSTAVGMDLNVVHEGSLHEQDSNSLAQFTSTLPRGSAERIRPRSRSSCTDHPLTPATPTTRFNCEVLHSHKPISVEKGEGDGHFEVNGSSKEDVQDDEASRNKEYPDKVCGLEPVWPQVIKSHIPADDRAVDENIAGTVTQLGPRDKRHHQLTREIPSHLSAREPTCLPLHERGVSWSFANVGIDDLTFRQATNSDETKDSNVNSVDETWTANTTETLDDTFPTTFDLTSLGLRDEVSTDTEKPLKPPSVSEVTLSDDKLIDSILAENTKMSREILLKTEIPNLSIGDIAPNPVGESKAVPKEPENGIDASKVCRESICFDESGDILSCEESSGSESDLRAFKSSTSILWDSRPSKRPFSGDTSTCSNSRVTSLSPIPEESDEEISSLM